QEILFARHQKEAGMPPGWLGIPVVVTSHTWENGKNEQSHQDPTLCEALLGEMSDTSRVLFPVDAATAVASLHAVYASRGVIATVVAPKQDTEQLFNGKQASQAVEKGYVALSPLTNSTRIQLVAIGAYQLREARRAAEILGRQGCQAQVIAILEPGRLRQPRDKVEAAFVLPYEQLAQDFPAGMARVIISHSRPEPMLGALRRIDAGPDKTAALGYINRGGTFDVEGMLFANHCTWAHIVAQAAHLLGEDVSAYLNEAS